MSQRFFNKVSLLFCVFIAGCSLTLEPNGRSGGDSLAAVSSREEDIGQLLAYTRDYHTLTAREKRAECQRLTRRYERNPDWQTGQTLVFAMTASAGCGSLQEAGSILDRMIAQKYISDELRWLAEYQVLMLKRQSDLQHRYQQLQHVQRKTAQRSNDLYKENRTLSARLKDLTARLNELTTKLEALKAIETNINKRLENEQE